MEPKKKYWYFVSYTYAKTFTYGTGCITFPLKQRIETNIEYSVKQIMKITKCKKVVIMYYKLLRLE